MMVTKSTRTRRLFVGLLSAGLILWAIFSLPPSAAAGMARESILAGTWYSANPAVLKDQINRFLQQVPPREKPGGFWR